MNPSDPTRFTRLLLLLLLGSPSHSSAQSNDPPGQVETDYAAGRRLLDAAIRATGDSAALARVGTLTTSFCARAVEVGQSAGPDAPYDTISAAGRRTYDLANRRYAQDWSTEFRGGIPLVLHEVVTDSGAYSTDLLGGVSFVVQPAGLQGSQRRVEENAPFAPLLILDRARRSATSVRVVRRASDKPGGDALLFVDRGALTTLELDARTHLLAAVETLYDNWATGLAAVRTTFRDYRRVGAIQLATRATTWFRHGLLTDVTFPDIAGAKAAAFMAPPDLAHAVPIGGSMRISIDSVAPRVFAIRYGQTAGPNFGYNPPFAYAQLLVELDDRLLIVDAPWSSSAEQAVIDTLRVLFPRKPVGVVAFTHYHSDHFGGLRPYVTKDVTFVTTARNRDFIERVAAAPHPSDPAASAGSSHPLPRIEIFAGTRTIADAYAPVELHEIGGAHADEMVIAFLPRQHLLFATDLFGIFPIRGGPGGSYEAERVLARYVKRHGWEIGTVISGHGAITPGAALDSVLEPAARRTGAEPVRVAACKSSR